MLEALARQFSGSAGYFPRAAQGHDYRPVRPDRTSKSIGTKRTFDGGLTDEADSLEALDPVVEAAWVRIERAGATGRTLALKAKFADVPIFSLAQTTVVPIATHADVANSHPTIGVASFCSLQLSSAGVASGHDT